jgi:adenylate cyclase
MNRMVGANVLGYFISGAYHRPKAEERIFLFLDLEGSTQLAERLGSARYFELLRRCVDDLTEPILETEGEIYQYAGDEVVVTWRVEDGVRAANCVRCFFGARQAIERRAARYERDFGAVPRFRGGLHGGIVTAGEIGDLRKQIVFVGDILNTAARLEEHAKRSGHELIVSQTVLDRLELPCDVHTNHCGELTLRGKHSRVIAYGLTHSQCRGLRPTAGCRRPD